MKITFMPKTAPGKWSAGLIGGMVLFFVLLFILAASGQRGGDTFSSNLALAMPGLLAAFCGIAAFFTGVIGIFFAKERLLLVFLTAFIGLDVLLFCLGEVLYPH